MVRSTDVLIVNSKTTVFVFKDCFLKEILDRINSAQCSTLQASTENCILSLVMHLTQKY